MRVTEGSVFQERRSGLYEGSPGQMPAPQPSAHLCGLPTGKKHDRKGREEKSGEGGGYFSFRHQMMSQKTVGLREVEDRAGLPLKDSNKHSGDWTHRATL